jgi:hypothetical protein
MRQVMGRLLNPAIEQLSDDGDQWQGRAGKQQWASATAE